MTFLPELCGGVHPDTGPLLYRTEHFFGVETRAEKKSG